MHHPTDTIAHTTAFVRPIVEHWLERDSPKEVTKWEWASSVLWFLLFLMSHIRSVLSSDALRMNLPPGCTTSPRTQLSWPSCRERKERNVLFNNALNTFYLRLYQPSHPVVVALLQRGRKEMLFNNALNIFFTVISALAPSCHGPPAERKEGNVLFNNALNTFYLRLYQPSHPVVMALLQRKEGKEMFYLTTHSTHFIYGYIASDIW